MKILLTGGSGMVGRNIVEYFQDHDYALLTPSSKELDLLNINSINSYLESKRPDMIIHAAGLVGGIQANVANPVKFLVNNMQMGINIIYASMSHSVSRFMNISSSCMYPRDKPNPLSEELILTGELEPTNEGYALAKISSTRLCEYITRENHAFLYKTLIPCNLYGKYDKFDKENSHMIPGVIKKISDASYRKDKYVDIWGDGLARREFMDAADLADFIFFAVNEFTKLPQNINVGIGEDYSVNEYYKTIAKVVGYKGSFKYDLSKPSGMKQKLLDISKMKALGWESKISLDEGIEKAHKYYLESIR